MRGTLLRASLAVGICLLAPPSAGATPPGVHVDPNSPGGKEYAIPLDQARNEATGGGGSQSSGGGSGSHLFGVGVGGSDSGGSGSAGTASSGDAGASKSGGSGSGGSGSGSSASRGSGHSRSAGVGAGGSHNRLSTLNVAAANPESGVQAPLLVLGGSAGIVLAGVLLGLMFRRRRISGGPSA
jgi:hypothetical protein